MSIPAKPNNKQSSLYIDLVEETHPFYTCGDPVRGIVRVDPTLRPKRIRITFKGFSLIHDQNANGATPKFFQYNQDLFVSSGAHENFDILQRGTASDGKVELPFEFAFPYNVWLSPPSNRNWRYSKDSYHHPRFQHSPGFVPPPTCTAMKSSNSALAPIVSYMLEVDLDSVMPDSPCVKVQKDINYLPPAPEYGLDLLQPNLDLGTTLPKHTARYKLIRTRKLLPGYQESSKLGKVKDLLVEKELFFGLATYSEVPYVRFNVLATPARVMVIGSQVPITITLQHLERSASLPNPPDLFMRRIRVQLIPTYHVFIPRIANGNHASKETVDATRDTLTLLDKKFEEKKGIPLTNNLEVSDVAEVMMVHGKLLPSFTSYGLALEYELQVDIWGECVKHEFSGIACREQIQVVSGWNATPPHLVTGEDDPLIALAELGPNGSRPDMGARVPSYNAYNRPPPQLEVTNRPMPPPYAA